MSFQDLIISYISYNHWANKRLTQWLSTLHPDIIYRQTNSSFASIDLTLQHMKNAQNFWYEIITNGDIKKLDETIIIKSIATVIGELLEGSQRMIDTCKNFNDQEFERKVTSPVMTKSRYDFILHVINHNSYHRGQIITMARLSGATLNIPETDYEAYLWMEETNSKS